VLQFLFLTAINHTWQLASPTILIVILEGRLDCSAQNNTCLTNKYEEITGLGKLMSVKLGVLLKRDGNQSLSSQTRPAIQTSSS